MGNSRGDYSEADKGRDPLTAGAASYRKRKQAEENERKRSRNDWDSLEEKITADSANFLAREGYKVVLTKEGLCFTLLEETPIKGHPYDVDDEWEYVGISRENELRIKTLLVVSNGAEGPNFNDLSARGGTLAKSCGVEFNCKWRETPYEQIMRVFGEFTAFHREILEERAAGKESQRIQSERRTAREEGNKREKEEWQSLAKAERKRAQNLSDAKVGLVVLAVAALIFLWLSS